MGKMKSKKIITSAAEKTGQSDQELKHAISMLNLLPSTCAATAIKKLSAPAHLGDNHVVEADFNTLADELCTQNKYIFEGDLSRVEAMLLDQSHTLQAIFTKFTKKMADAEYISQLEAYSRIALKAQNQCRQTLATLGELKNPKRTTFIKQMNNAVNQQINQNGKRDENLKNSENSTNEILEELPHERLDTRTPQSAIRENQAVETVEEGHRAKDTGGEA